jgi:hypothetical protein
LLHKDFHLEIYARDEGLEIHMAIDFGGSLWEGLGLDEV